VRELDHPPCAGRGLPGQPAVLDAAGQVDEAFAVDGAAVGRLAGHGRHVARTGVAFGLDNSFVGAEGEPGFDTALADPANYQIISVPFAPDYYSADYRLSELQSFTYGVNVAVQVHERVAVVLGYRRYDMQGLEPGIADATYPDAHIFNVGLSANF
jgi:hypothetical protein